MFENLNLDQLLAAQKELQEKLEDEKQNAIMEIVERMKLMNITVEDIQSFFVQSKPVSISKAKYRNPHNPSDTWTGKGKPPKWFKDSIEKGIEKETMLIR